MLEFKNLRAGYGKENIIDGSSFQVRDGQITVLVGKNGCGKSTLIKCVNRQLPVRSGDILLDGRSIAEYTPKERAKKLAILPQVRNIPNISVKGLISHGRYPYLGVQRRLKKEDYDIIEAAMEITHTSELAERNVEDLSGGQRQRVYIAMTLAQDADYILLDEPSSYLDITYQLEMADMLGRLKGMGKTVLAVYHDLSQALRLADSMVVMDKGRAIFQGSSEKCVKDGVLDRLFNVRSNTIETDGGSYTYFI